MIYFIFPDCVTNILGKFIANTPTYVPNHTVYADAVNKYKKENKKLKQK